MALRSESLSSVGSDELLAYVLTDEWCTHMPLHQNCAMRLLLACSPIVITLRQYVTDARWTSLMQRRLFN